MDAPAGRGGSPLPSAIPARSAAAKGLAALPDDAYAPAGRGGSPLPSAIPGGPRLAQHLPPYR